MEKVKVKIVGVNCAHRKGRNTAWMIQYCLKAAEKAGRRLSEVADVETEFFDLADKKIKMCLQCYQHCTPNKGFPWKGTEMPQDFDCIIKDDYLAREVMPKLAEADGFIFGSPVYMTNIDSKLKIIMERLNAGIFKGYFTNKPGLAVSTATMAFGQGNCLKTINNIMRELEMVPIAWMQGVPSASGAPYGPPMWEETPMDIGVKGDKLAHWWAVIGARRLVEFAVMLKLAKNQLGDIYRREFIQIYHPPHGEEPWAWETLDEEDEEYMANLTPPPKKEHNCPLCRSLNIDLINKTNNNE